MVNEAGKPVAQSESFDVTFAVAGPVDFRAAFNELELSLKDARLINFIMPDRRLYYKGVVARNANRVIGVAAIQRRDRLGLAAISRYVRPGEQYRRRGIGARLLEMALNECKNDGLPEVHIDSATAQGLASVRKFLDAHPEWKDYVKWDVQSNSAEEFADNSKRVDEEEA